MIVAYYRPDSMEEALRLLEKSDPVVYPLGGGSVLSQPSAGKYAVMDLQRLGLDRIETHGNSVQIGAAVCLQALMDDLTLPPALRTAARREANANLRQTVTIGGTIVTTKGNSPLVTALLALDARMIWQPGEVETGVGEYLALRHDWQAGRLITQIRVPAGVLLRYTDVARTPEDQPVVCAAVASWPGGRTRIVLGGPGVAPVLAMDGLTADGAEDAAHFAYSHLGQAAGMDETFLRETSRVLVRRLLAA